MKKISIGRDINSTIVIDQFHGRVSNKHADIEIRDGQLIFIDHSSNGTLINGKFIHNAAIVIRNGDIISLANSYVLPWDIIQNYFPVFQKRTEMFVGFQIDPIISDKKDKTFVDFQIDPINSDRKTVTFDGSNTQHIEPGRATETINNISINEVANNITNEENLVRGQLNEYTQVEIDEILEKFNIGAFLSSWVWALAKGIYWPLIIIPISFIPYLGQICSLFLCTHLGIVGYKKAWQSYKGNSFAKFIEKQNKWVAWGCLFFILFAFIQFCSLYFILIEI